ncbi:hypothetical protein QTJ16_000379 [Diplocarpon rosae]|uniref:Altered inheritance of mitochondria protein 9, mitochondrial n=1 Tax=Diplocarpon rosae TaxID=946125 RepID=A0AAD9T6L8_9HELO|nr:hypothetical protein QTJ16_000379 [Diplocarpon rosae]
MIRQVVEIERKLVDTNFKHCGGIYFKEVAPDSERLIKTIHGAIDYVGNKAVSEKYFLGQHGHPRLNYVHSRVELEQPRKMLELLDKYLKLSPAMLPPPIPDDIEASVLWHPDLHLDNIFIDPDTLQITNVIDWQSTTTAPLLYQCGVPRMVRHQEPVPLDLSHWPGLCDNYEGLGQADKDYAVKIHRSECLHQYYLRVTRKDNPRHWTALQLPNEQRVQPVKIVQQVGENNTVFFLRRALRRIAANWEKLCPSAGPCPVSFDEEDLSLFNREVEKRGFVSGTLNIFQKTCGLKPDGAVEPSKYAEIQAELDRIKAVCLEAVEDDEERF